MDHAAGGAAGLKMLPAGGYKCIAGDMRTSQHVHAGDARRCERTSRRQGCVRVALFLPANPLWSRGPTRNAIIAIGLPPRATGRTPTAAGAPWRCTIGDWSHTLGTAWTCGATSAPAVSANGVGTRRAVGGAGINATTDAHHGRNGSGWRRSAGSACAGLNRWAASRRGAAEGIRWGASLMLAAPAAGFRTRDPLPYQRHRPGRTRLRLAVRI